MLWCHTCNFQKFKTVYVSNYEMIRNWEKKRRKTKRGNKCLTMSKITFSKCKKPNLVSRVLDALFKSLCLTFQNSAQPSQLTNQYGDAILKLEPNSHTVILGSYYIRYLKNAKLESEINKYKVSFLTFHSTTYLKRCWILFSVFFYLINFFTFINYLLRYWLFYMKNKKLGTYLYWIWHKSKLSMRVITMAVTATAASLR